MLLKLTIGLAASMLMISCSSNENAPLDSSDTESAAAVDSSQGGNDVPRDTTPIDETDSITTTTGADGTTEEGYGTSKLTDALIKTGLIVYMEATSAAYKANDLKETETFEGLDRYLSDSAEAWVDGVVGAANKGVLPVDATFAVNGVDFQELTASAVKPADGISLSLTLRKVTCTMVGTFYEKADLSMVFSWAAPTCVA